jgi:molybdenum cofactor biosynthesis enzyme
MALEAISYHFGMLEHLYRNAGLHPDMEPDMVPDEKLRQRMYEEYAKIAQFATKLEEVAGKDPAFNEAQPNHVKEGNTDSYKEKKKTDIVGGIKEGVETVQTINSYPSQVLGTAKKIKKATENKKLEEFLNKKAVGFTGVSLSVISAVCTGLLTAYNMYKLWNKEGLTSADKFAQWTGHFGKAGSSLVSTGNTITGILTTTGKVSEKAAGMTKATTALSVGGIVFSTVGTVVAGIQLGRAVSCGNDVERAQKELNKKNKNARSMEEKKLARFLKHQELDIMRQKGSKSVTFVNSCIGLFGGIASLTGVLLPVAIVAGVTAFTANEMWSKFGDKEIRNSIILRAVDDQLGIGNLVNKIRRNHPNKDKLKRMDNEKLKNMVRDEALAGFGYTSYKKYFKQVCTEFAKLLYSKVFEENLTVNEKQMYKDALESLGMKIKEPAVGSREKPYPTISAIVTKLMG